LRGRGCIHGGGGGGRLGTGSDGWGPRGSERGFTNGRSTLTDGVHRAARERMCGCRRIGADRPGPPGSGWERRENARARTRAVAGRWGPPDRRRERARYLARPSWADWAEMAFSFF
jgi:hypothetical protein